MPPGERIIYFEPDPKSDADKGRPKGTSKLEITIGCRSPGDQYSTHILRTADARGLAVPGDIVVTDVSDSTFREIMRALPHDDLVRATGDVRRTQRLIMDALDDLGFREVVEVIQR